MNKNRAKFIIIAVILLVIVALIIFYLLYSRTTTGPGGEFPDFPDGSPGTGVEPGGGESGGGIPGTGATEPGYGFDVTPPDRYTNAPGVYKRLKRISSLPVAGYTVFDKNNDSFIRYAERASGYLFETKAITAESPYRIAETKINRIYEAYWTNNSESLILRFLKPQTDDIQTFFVTLKEASEGSSFEVGGGVFLPQNITALTVSPSTKKIFYIQKNGDEAVGIVSNPDGSNKKQIYDSPISEWQPIWNDDRKILLTTSPSYLARGFVYELNPETGSWNRVFGNITGITILPNQDSSRVAFFAITQSDSVNLGIYNAKTRTSIRSGVKTIPEKCAWSKTDSKIIYCAVDGSIPLNNMPDSWYMGVTSFTDRIWKINTDTGESNIIFDPQSLVAEKMDMFDLQLDSKDKHLVFRNKKDLSLWLYDLEEN